METGNAIRANAGKILTNGEIYGKWISPAKGVSVADFYEITEEEYEEYLRVKSEREMYIYG